MHLHLQDYQNFLQYFNDCYIDAEKETLEKWELENDEMNVDHPDRDKFNEEVGERAEEMLNNELGRITEHNEVEIDGHVFHNYTEEQIEEIKNIFRL